ncbi:MAG: phage-shock protein [Clostridia bacterium]|nr:phage-shock protein [Clostridia bacterium]
MLSLAVCLVGGLIALVVLMIVGLPLMLLLGFSPWFLGLVGVILLIKALLEKPMVVQSFYPAAIALISSAVLRWIF